MRDFRLCMRAVRSGSSADTDLPLLVSTLRADPPRGAGSALGVSASEVQHAKHQQVHRQRQQQQQQRRGIISDNNDECGKRLVLTLCRRLSSGSKIER